jgi:hypothetical protein
MGSNTVSQLFQNYFRGVRVFRAWVFKIKVGCKIELIGGFGRLRFLANFLAVVMVSI